MPESEPDDADRFLDDIVWPTVWEFMHDPGNTRRGLLAALTISHLADYFVATRLSACSATVRNAKLQKRVRSLRTEWAKACPEFGWVEDMADATKHVQLDRQSAGLKNLSGIHKSEVRLVDNNGVEMLFPSEEGDFALILGVEDAATLPDGSRRALMDIFQKAMMFLQKQMGRPPEWTLPPQTGCRSSG